MLCSCSFLKSLRLLGIRCEGNRLGHVIEDMQFNRRQEDRQGRDDSQVERYARNNLTHGICCFNVNFAVTRSLFISK